MSQIQNFTCSEVSNWLVQNGFGSHVNNFISCEIDGALLVEMTHQELTQDFGFRPLDANNLLSAIQRAKSTTGYSSGGYTPSAAGMGTTTASYVPSAAATGSTYVPSAAARGMASTYTPSAAASTYTPSAAATGYVPSAAASTYTTSAAASTYTPSAAASAPFGQALNLPPPATTTTTTNIATRAPFYEKPEQPLQTVMATPYTTTTTAIQPLKSSYQHGNGPTHGVVSQANQPVKCHKVDYEIKGSEMQLVEIHLDPEETVIAEAGAMMYLEDDVDFKTKFGDGSEPKQGFFKKLMAGAGRLMTGESLFITHFTNKGQRTRIAAFAAPYPGTILPIDMMELQQLYPSGNPDKPTSLICQRDAFLCAAKGTKIEMHLHKKIGSGLFGGEGFILQKLKGDGMAFVHAGGCIVKRELKQGEKLRVDTGCLVAYTSPGIDNDIQMAPGLKTMFFGGEGLFLATLRATSPQGGTVWLQSLPFSRFADRVIAHAPSVGGKQTDGSRLTGGFGDLIDGDGFSGFKKSGFPF